MNRESRLSHRLTGALKKIGALCHYHRHEDSQPGVPDMSYAIDGVSGWIELKQIEKWPKRASTVVRIDHYTPFQKVWLYKRSQAGVNCFVLLMTPEDDYWLFGKDSFLKVGELTKQELLMAADCVTPNMMDIICQLAGEKLNE